MVTNPVTVELEVPERVANWRPLVHWLLVIPQAVVVGVLGNVAGAVAFIAWFAIVFTGRMPEGLASFECLVIRYQARVSSYALWLREPYPAFEFELTPVDPGDDPVRVDLRPQLEERNRLTVALRMFLLIPITLFLAVVGFAAFFVSVAGFFAVLFGGRWPGGMHRFLTGTIRLGARVGAYGYLLVDEYPPFSVA